MTGKMKHTVFSFFSFFPPKLAALFLTHWHPWGAIGLFISNPFKLCIPLLNIECCGCANLPVWNKWWHWVLLAFPIHCNVSSVNAASAASLYCFYWAFKIRFHSYCLFICDLNGLFLSCRFKDSGSGKLPTWHEGVKTIWNCLSCFSFYPKQLKYRDN